MFIPPSKDSLLLKFIEEEEEKLSEVMDWKIKLMEQSGIPLSLTFIPKFPLIEGCPRGNECILCNNTNIKCRTKGVIYKATCLWCKDGIEPENMCTDPELFMLLQELGTDKQDSGDVVTMDDCSKSRISSNMSAGQEVSEQTGCGMDGMNNKGFKGGDGERSVGMNGMNNISHKGGGK